MITIYVGLSFQMPKHASPVRDLPLDVAAEAGGEARAVEA
jgi:hypothetical protein